MKRLWFALRDIRWLHFLHVYLTIVFTYFLLSFCSVARCVASSAPRRASVVVRASQQPQPTSLSRREAAAAALAAFVAVATPAGPARAFLGIGEDGNERYAAETAKIIADMTTALDMAVTDPAREEALKSVRKETVSWVSRYRRDPKYSGRPSYSNLYSAVNALDGQLNSFGFTSKVPAKRLDRILKEISDADKQLQRGR